VSTCELPLKPRAGDIPHTALGDMQRQHLNVDLDGCNVYVIAQAMNEYHRGKSYGLRYEGWPQEVQTIFDREIAAWSERNPDRAARAYTISTADATFTLALHGKMKS
jgi:hypothetical protein